MDRDHALWVLNGNQITLGAVRCSPTTPPKLQSECDTMKRIFFLAATVLTALSPLIAFAVTVQNNLAITVTPPAGGSSVLPADRDASANWKMAGMRSVGGIPNRTPVCASLSPQGGGADDTSAINAAINACPVGQVVSLTAGTPIPINPLSSTHPILSTRPRKADRLNASARRLQALPAHRCGKAFLIFRSLLTNAPH